MMMPNYPKRKPLAHLPTPLQPLQRLQKHLNGPGLWIKRDDQTGLATGGNKARKLEFLVAEALARGHDHLVTTGSAQSNHCRQTAAAAARYGLGCSLVLTGSPPPRFTGNLLLSTLLGAHLYWTEAQNSQLRLEQVSQELRQMGRSPYQIPLGGSNVVGATGYVFAMKEMVKQLEEYNLNVDFIVLASGSGGTQAGLVLGAEVYDSRAQIMGISIFKEAAALQTQVAALATATAAHLGLETPAVGHRVNVNDDYLGEGYGIVGEPEREAIQMVAQLEGILLDPVYTGRAMGGLIDLIRWGAFTRRQTILFWHTGGTATLSTFADKLA